MSSKKEFYSREFLNRRGHHSTAYIFGEIEKSISKGKLNKKTGKVSKDRVWYYCDLKISDCDRIISLNIDTDNKRELNNSIRKLDILINFLNKYKARLESIMKNEYK